MPKFAVVAHDPQVDIYYENSFYGAEIVEAQSKEEAIQRSFYGELAGLHLNSFEVSDKNELGNCDQHEIIHKEEDI